MEEINSLMKTFNRKFMDLDVYVANLMNSSGEAIDNEMRRLLIEKYGLKESVKQKLPQSDIRNIALFAYDGGDLRKITDALNSIPDDLIQYADKMSIDYNDNQKRLYVRLVKEHGDYDTELRLSFDMVNSVYLEQSEFVFVRKKEYVEEAYVNLLDNSRYFDELIDLLDTIYRAKNS